MKDVSTFLRQLSFHVFMHFCVIKLESKQFCEIFVVNSLNYWFFKRFLLINLDKIVFYPKRYPDSVPHLCTECYQLTTISFIIFWDFSMFDLDFLSPQVKRWAIITYNHGIYELPHESPNDLRLTILGNKKISGKGINLIECLAASPPAKMKVC